MKCRRRLWMPAPMVFVALVAACAAEGTDTAQVAETAPEPIIGQAGQEASELEAAPDATELELESVPTTRGAESEPEPAPTTNTVTEPIEEEEPLSREDEASDQLTPTPEPSSGVAAVLAHLDALTVAAEHTSGYDRHLFKHWTDEDGDGCDTRREVLLAEAVVTPVQGSRCSLSGGEWISRYDGLTEQGNGRGFDVDHLVPLAESWESGAHGWSPDRREQYANDLGYEHSLVAVSARSNRSKGAQDPATWLPPEHDQHCWYAAAWVHVKTRWSLTVDAAEVDSLEGILEDCSDDAIDVGVPAPVVEQTDTEASTDSATEDTATETPSEDCHPAYTPCLPNLAGDALNCGDLSPDQKPVTVNEIGVDPYRLDRDGDGRSCTS